MIGGGLEKGIEILYVYELPVLVHNGRFVLLAIRPLLLVLVFIIDSSVSLHFLTLVLHGSIHPVLSLILCAPSIRYLLIFCHILALRGAQVGGIREHRFIDALRSQPSILTVVVGANGARPLSHGMPDLYLVLVLGSGL